MNSNTPYNSGVMKNMVNKVKIYCSKIIPLVFDNTLSYYESLCGFCAKVNELCDAVNSQNLTITEFCHMVELEIEKFEEYVNTEIGAINETISDILDRVREVEGVIDDIQTALADKVDKTDVTNVVEANNENPVTSGAVYEAIQESSGTTVREAQANPTYGIIKGILSTDFQNRNNPLSIYNGTLIMREATNNQTGYVQIGDNINVENGIISVPLASPTAKGLVMASNIDSGITAYNGTIRVNLADPLYIDTTHNRIDIKYATNTQLGVVAPKLGGALNIQSAGEIDAKNATTSQRGVVVLTDTVSSGDTSRVPTSDAVYQAIQQGGGGGTIPDATTTTKGKVQIGTNMTVSNGVISVPVATHNSLGVVTISDTDSNLTLDEWGFLNVPNANTARKGVIQVGDNLRINSGVLSVPEASTTAKGAVMVDSIGSISANSGVIDVKLGNYMTRNQTGAISPTVADDTAGTLGVVGSTLGGSITINNGEINVKQATTSQQGTVRLASTLGSQLTNVVPTADVVWNECAPRGLENLAVRSATPDSDGNSQLYKVDAQGVSTNVTPLIPDASLLTKGVLKVSNSNGLTISNGTLNINRADEVTWGTVRIGDNIVSNNGEISVSDASINTAGVVMLDDVVTESSTNVPTSDAVYQAIVSMLQNGGFSRTLQLEHNSNPNGGAECIVTVDTDGATSVPTNLNIKNANNLNNTVITLTAAISVSNATRIHLYIKTSLYPTNLDYTSQMKATTLEYKRDQYDNGWSSAYLVSSDLRHISWNVGDSFTNTNGETYRHIYGVFTNNLPANVSASFRVKIDY